MCGRGREWKIDCWIQRERDAVYIMFQQIDNTIKFAIDFVWAFFVLFAARSVQ